MSQTFQAILRGDRVEWLGDAPASTGDVHVEIIVPGEPAPVADDVEARRKALMAAMDALVRSGVAAKFGDPVEWQRETRKDRPLPGREG